MCVDSGTIGRNTILNIVLINANQKEESPLLFKSVWNFSGTSKSYKKEIKDSIIELSEFGIMISGLVTDNLSVQVKALDHRKPKSVMNQENTYGIQTKGANGQ